MFNKLLIGAQAATLALGSQINRGEIIKTMTISNLSTPVLTVLSLIFFGAAIITAQPGDLDPTFGNGGKLTDGPGLANGVAIQPDGKLIVVGGKSGGFTSNAFMVARYNGDGSRDTTFGGDGEVTTDIGFSYELAQAVAIQPNGKIVVAGTTWDGSGSQWGHFSLVRYNPDGSLDLSFGGGDGIVVTENLGTGWVTANAVAIQADGKIVVAGMSDYNLYDFPYLTVIRYNPDGSLDTSFGGDGIGENSVFMRFQEAYSVAIQTNGKIVAAGYYYSAGNGADFAIARYNADGTLDTTFSGDGIVNTRIGPFTDMAKSVAIQTDGKIVAAGFSDGARQYLTVIRYDPDGSLDPTFDGDGIVTTLVGTDAGASSIAVQSDGKLVVAGTGHNGFNTDFAIARFNSNGSLDTAFGGGDGSTLIDFDISSDKAYGMALDNAGRVLVVGESQGRFALARLLGNQVRSNGKIAFTSDRDGNLEIYVMNNDGTQQVRLTNNTDTDCLPAVSPDGRKIAFVSKQTTSGNVYIKIMNADGTEQTELTQISSSTYLWHADRSLSWSPDGRKIAFDSEYEIFTINVDGSNRTNLTNNPARDFAPAWSPDGSRILFVSYPNGGRARLHTMNADGSDVRALPSVVGLVDYSPEWSPTGNQIAFVVGSEDFLPILYTADADGTNRQIFDGNGIGSLHRNRPKWSPDGTKIVFHMWNFVGDDCEIYVKKVNGGGAAQLTNTIGHNFQPSWQPLAAFVSVSGRVTRPGGQGLANAVVSMTDSLGVTRTATASTFGYYSFDNVPIGETYTIFVASRRYRFLPRTLTIADNLTDIDFAGQE